MPLKAFSLDIEFLRIKFKPCQCYLKFIDNSVALQYSVFTSIREKLVLHKTFHRYVVRAKRGTAQGTRDSQGNAPKSAGASIRRHNEAALKEVPKGAQILHPLFTI